MPCWTDPPHHDAAIETLSEGVIDPELGPANVAASRLENDLDLRILAQDGSELKPWVLDKNNPLSPAVPVLRISSISFENNNRDRVWMELDGFVGVNYQLESSPDLVNWTKVDHPFVVTTRPQPLAVHSQYGHRDASYYRVKEIAPLE